MGALNTVQIENNPDLVRDLSSKAVISTDLNGLRRYKEQRRKTVTQRNEFIETKTRLATIEGEMVTLKRIVSELMTLRNKG